MRVNSYKLRICTSPIHVPFTISKESLPSATVVTCEVITDTGHRGHGECAPFPSLTYDDIASAKATAETILGQCIGLSVDEALLFVERHFKAYSAKSITGVVGVECALWDLKAQAQSLPLARLFGTSRTETLSTDITMPIMPPQEIKGFWQLYEPYGFTTIKVKISGNVRGDSDMLAALVALAPAGLSYILDCNQGCSVASAVAILDVAQRLGMNVLFCEQPLPERDLSGLSQLARLTGVPLCVDETVRSVADLHAILELGLKPIVNIKIMKSGVSQALQIIKLAVSSGCPLMIGGMLESEIAMGFSLHIACGTGAFTYADLDTPFFFKQRLTLDSPWHRHAALLQLPKGDGLGLALAISDLYK